jgi:hypothetical protein
MGMMFGFGDHRRRLLQAELLRMAGELPALGGRGTLLVQNISSSATVLPETGLQLVVILDSDEPFHRRPDFLVSHLRPRVGTQFFVYTPAEFETLRDSDPVIRFAQRHGQVIDEPS